MPVIPLARDLEPSTIKSLLDRGAITLIDVREPSEFAAERIHGALNFPLSSFDPRALPVDADRPVVLQCGSGKRSAAALEACARAGVDVGSHMLGGIMRWEAAGLPTVRFDPATGRVVELG